LFRLGRLRIFINAPPLIIVFVYALLFSIAGIKDLKNRDYNFPDGAVLDGWISLLIGGIVILANQDFYNWAEATFPISYAIMFFTILWLRAEVRVFFNRRGSA
jgi:hypothetical protein